MTKQTIICSKCGTSKGYMRGKRQGNPLCPKCYCQEHRATTKNPQPTPAQIKQELETIEVVKPASKPIAMPNVEINPIMQKFVPMQDGYIPRKIENTTDLAIIETAYKNKHFTIITGECGSGKTSLIRHFAYIHKLPYARINLNGGTTADELIGRWVPDELGKFKWQDGMLTTFVRYGGVLVIDEINSCPPEITFCLHSLTDDEHTISLLDKDNEVIHAHPDFFLASTMNPDYEGTKPLNKALKDRAQCKMNFDYDTSIEEKLIKDKTILTLASKLRIMRDKGEISTPISTRLLLYHQQNCELYGEKVAFKIFLDNFENHEKEPIRNVVEMLSKGESKAIAKPGSS